MLLCPKTFASLHRPVAPLRHVLSSSSSTRSLVPSPPFASPARPPTAARPLHRRSPLRLVAFSTATSSSEPPAAPAVAAAAAVEHVVLFKARDGTDPAKIDAMVSNLRGLASLDGVLHLSTAPVLRLRSSAAAALGFTHLLHSRYPTKDDLAAYAAHPAHLSVVREHVLPICDDLMAVDWVTALDTGLVPPRPGSVARVTLAKLKEGAGDAGKGEVLAALGGVRASLPGAIEQFSYGENFSPERAKGYSVCSIAVFPSREELDGVEAKWGDSMEAQKEKVRPHLESVVVLDFIVPPAAAISGL